ncbi:hypothetical protein [Lachnobacterium bovis]|uniref:hypothetical protein n=1 Tax=Lachnobacterium bovis TaxID=140626 RepID=UPI000687E3DC|nr:hypothetical protein [Lachnobacterium bovis]
MNKVEFKEWLFNNSDMKGRAVSDAASRCMRIEKSFQVDIEKEYKKDKCESLFAMISYGKKDKDKGLLPPKELKLDTSKNSVASISQLRYSLKKYKEFIENR